MNLLGVKIAPWSWRIGEIIITPYTVAFLLTLPIFLFLAFRVLYKDHDPQEAVRFSIKLLLSFLLGGRFLFVVLHFSQFGFDLTKWIAFWPKAGISFLGGLLAAIAYTTAYCRYRHLSVWFFLEKLVGPILFLGILLAISYFLSFGEVAALGRAVIIIIVFLTRKLFSRYRSFSWYPSGRVGFLFLSSVIVYSILEQGLDFLLFSSLYWQRILILRGVVVLVCLILGYRLSGLKLKSSYWFFAKNEKEQKR